MIKRIDTQGLQALLALHIGTPSTERWLKVIDIRYNRIKKYLGKEIAFQSTRDLPCLFKDGNEVPFGSHKCESQLIAGLSTQCHQLGHRLVISDEKNTLKGDAKVILLTEDGWALLQFRLGCMGTIPDTEEFANDVRLLWVTPESLIEKHGITPVHLSKELGKLLNGIAEIQRMQYQETADLVTLTEMEDTVHLTALEVSDKAVTRH